MIGKCLILQIAFLQFGFLQAQNPFVITFLNPERSEPIREDGVGIRVNFKGESPILPSEIRGSRGKPLYSYSYTLKDDKLISTSTPTPEPISNSQSNNFRNLSPNNIDSTLADPPPHEQVAKMARFIVANSNWTSMATTSTRDPIEGFPFANVFSLSDGPNGNSTGVPYMYLTPLEISVQDLQKDNRASMTMSLAQSDYCRRKHYDPEDPRCAHVILTGGIMKIAESSQEGQFAKKALFSRHPEMDSWPKDHDWFFAKLDIFNILVLDYFGGAKSVTPKEYFNAYN